MKPVKKTSSSILEEFVGRKLKFVNCQNSILKEIVGRTLKFVTYQSTANLETFCFKSMISRSMPGENIFNLNNRFCCSSYLSLPWCATWRCPWCLPWVTQWMMFVSIINGGCHCSPSVKHSSVDVLDYIFALFCIYCSIHPFNILQIKT